MPDVVMAPFVVNGSGVAVAIHARSRSDRRYAQKFAEEVVQVVDATMDAPLGRGLVIIGRRQEPHPFLVFNQFLALADAGQLDPAIAADAAALRATTAQWREVIDVDDDDTELSPELIMPALPIPLEGVASRLYQLAWTEGLDETRIHRRLTHLTADEWQSDGLQRFDWVFYLPPRTAFDDVLDAVLAQEMKGEKMGFFARATVRSVMVFIKPKIRRILENVRQGMMYYTVLRARSDYTPDEIKTLTGTYISALMEEESGSREPPAVRAATAIQAKKLELATPAPDEAEA